MRTKISELISYYKLNLLSKFLQIEGIYSNEKEKTKLLNKIISSFENVFTPSQNLALDEGMAPFHGICKYLWYCPQKPDKWGVKFFILADSKTGTVAIPYFRKSTYD